MTRVAWSLMVSSPFLPAADPLASDKLGLSNPWQGRGPAAPFDMPFYLIFNVAVGGASSCVQAWV